LYYNKKIPIAYKPQDYGTVISQKENRFTIAIDKKTFIILEQFDNYNLIEYYKNGKLLYEWKDIYLNENTFTRELGKNIYTFEDNVLILQQVNKPVKFIKKIKTSGSPNHKIITMDLETVLIDNVQTPYLLCWYDGENKKSYFLNDFKDFKQILNCCLDDILIRKYRNYKIYFHNLSGFDGVLILTLLANINGVKIKPIYHESKLKGFNLKYKNKKVQFKDSYLLLPKSLKELGESFNVKTQKSVFPVLYYDINHVGLVPDFKYFSNISLNEYLDHYLEYHKVNKFWNFKEEAVKYCFNDCISLYEILVNFNTLIFDKFKLNINDYLTLPSLTVAIYRSKYLPVNQVPGLAGEIFNNIKQSYTGGSVDMFIPYNEPDELVFAYDVNSLFPFVMANNPMPIGQPNYFEGDIKKSDPSAFGFFFVEVEAPSTLDHPIIQLHHKVNDGIRTISPIGKFKLMLFSEEMDNALKFGYKFKILWGYTFDKGYIFKEFIDILYDLRINYPKTDPMNFIAKLLMNSLYGRFGMSDNFNEVTIIDESKYKSFENKHIDTITSVMQLNKKYLITLEKEKDYLNVLLDNGSINHNINIAIASAVTAYSRIYMSQFKNNDDYKLFYSDTDSIYINKPLPSDLVSSTEIGKMKLEGIYNKAVFLAPKVYGLATGTSETLKIKGVKKEAIKNIKFKDLEKLLIRDSKLEILQDKWFKSFNLGRITIKEQLYTLVTTSNKRMLLHDENNKLFDTLPLKINLLSP
jgi:hypothetical protein